MTYTDVIKVIAMKIAQGKKDEAKRFAFQFGLNRGRTKRFTPLQESYKQKQFNGLNNQP